LLLPAESSRAEAGYEGMSENKELRKLSEKVESSGFVVMSLSSSK
jgi:hypothetical protein